jgi:hypothetical protein
MAAVAESAPITGKLNWEFPVNGAAPEPGRNGSAATVKR